MKDYFTADVISKEGVEKFRIEFEQENKNLTLIDKFYKLEKYRTDYSVEAVVCREYEKLLYEQTENNLLELLKGFTAKDANGILFKVIDSVKQKTDNLIL